MTEDLHARLARALEECRVLTPEAQASAIMTVVKPELAALKDERDQWRRDFFKASVQRGEVMAAQQERDEAFSAVTQMVQQRDDAEAALAGAAATCRALMLAAEKLYLDWPQPGTPEHRRAVVEAIRAAEKRLARLPVADLDEAR